MSEVLLSAVRTLVTRAFGNSGGVVVFMNHGQYTRWRHYERNFCEAKYGDERFADGKPRLKVDQIGKQTKEAVARRSGGKCEVKGRYCTVDANDIHHIIFKSMGGTNELENLKHTCIPCHQDIHGQWIKKPKEKGETIGDRLARMIRWR